MTIKAAQARVLHADCIDAMREMEADSIDAIVTDPPYGLAFMGKGWDHGVPGVEFWREALRVAKPGAHLVAFGGTRTFHRLACAIEDAGWEIRDCLSWNYGSGFPKSLNVSKAIEKLGEDTHGLLPEEQKFCDWMREESGLDAATVKRITGSARFITGEVEIVNTATVDNPRWGRRAMVPTDAAWKKLLSVMTVTPPEWIVELVKDPPSPPIEHPGEWKPGRGQGTQGTNKWQGWGTALKPAWEPIILARKPLVGTVAANVLAHGTGALNIDGCRIGVSGGTAKGTFPRQQSNNCYGNGLNGGCEIINLDAGRWPANVTLDEEAAAMLDEQSGVTTSSDPGTTHVQAVGWGHSAERRNRGYPGDRGGASRFFYTAKASRKERGEGNTHPTVKPLALMRWLVKLVTPKGGVVLDPFCGSGSTLVAAVEEGFDCIGIEREAEYVQIIKKRIS